MICIFLNINSIESDEKAHMDRKKTKKEDREKYLKKYLGCEFIRINPDKDDFDVYVEIGKICNHNNKST